MNLRFPLKWLFLVIGVIALSFAAFVLGVRSGERRGAAVERSYQMGRALLEVANRPGELTEELLEIDFDSTVRNSGGVTIGPVAILHQTEAIAEKVIQLDVDLRSDGLSLDGLEAAIWQNSPSLVGSVLQTGQFQPAEIPDYVRRAEQRTVTFEGRNSVVKSERFEQNRNEIYRILNEYRRTKGR
ncbi:MAG: hypothetical protein AAF958_12880 [Planctomycetota bacterium]